MKNDSLKLSFADLIAVVAGLSAALLIIFVFQLQKPEVFPPLEQQDPAFFYSQTEKFKPKQIRLDLLGLVIGVYAGSLIASLIARKNGIVHALLVPVLVVVLITGFTFQKELLFLFLPCWMMIALGAYYTSYFIKKRRNKSN